MFGFDKTWSFLMVEGAWRILRECILHVHKLHVMSYTFRRSAVFLLL